MRKVSTHLTAGRIQLACCVKTATLLALLAACGSPPSYSAERQEVEQRLVEQLNRESMRSPWCASLLRHLGRESDGSKPSGIRLVKEVRYCVFHCVYSDGRMKMRRVFVFLPGFRELPRVQQKTVIITDHDYHLINWAQISGIPEAFDFELGSDGHGTAILRFTCVGPGAREVERHAFSLWHDGIVKRTRHDRSTVILPMPQQ